MAAAGSKSGGGSISLPLSLSHLVDCCAVAGGLSLSLSLSLSRPLCSLLLAPAIMQWWRRRLSLSLSLSLPFSIIKIVDCCLRRHYHAIVRWRRRCLSLSLSPIFYYKIVDCCLRRCYHAIMRWWRRRLSLSLSLSLSHFILSNHVVDCCLYHRDRAIYAIAAAASLSHFLSPSK